MTIIGVVGSVDVAGIVLVIFFRVLWRRHGKWRRVSGVIVAGIVLASFRFLSLVIIGVVSVNIGIVMVKCVIVDVVMVGRDGIGEASRYMMSAVTPRPSLRSRSVSLPTQTASAVDASVILEGIVIDVDEDSTQFIRRL